MNGYQKIIRRTVFATEDYGATQGVCFATDGHVVHGVATDGKTLAVQAALSERVGKHKIDRAIVRVDTLALLGKILRDKSVDDWDIVKMAVDKHAVTFQVGNVTLFTRLVEGRFPHWRGIVPNVQDNGIYFQTKTGSAMEEALEILDGKQNVAWYITVTCADDELSQRIEPGAPPTSERLEWAMRLAKAGYMVIVAFNPLVEKWMPKKALTKILNKLQTAGVHHFYFDSLHLEKKRRYGANLLELAGYTEAYLDSDDLSWDTEDYVLDVMQDRAAEYTLAWDMNCDIVYLDLIAALGGGFRTVSDYKIVVEQGLQEGCSGFTWNSFWEFMSEGNEELFEREFPTSWLERYLFVQQRQVYKEHPPLRSYKDLLKLIWNDQRFTCSLLNHRGYKCLEKDDCGDVVLGLRSLLVDDRGRLVRDYEGRTIELQT